MADDQNKLVTDIVTVHKTEKVRKYNQKSILDHIKPNILYMF